MLKRLLAVIVCIVMLMAVLVACGSGDDNGQPDLVKAATEKLAVAKYKLTQTNSITCTESTLGYSIDKNEVDVIYYDGENFWFESDGLETLFADKIYYYKFGDDKIKMTVGDAFGEIEESIGAKLAVMGVKDISVYESVEKTENSNGTTTVVLSSPKDINALGATILSGLGMGESIGISIDEESFKQTVVLDADGRFQSVEQYMKLTVIANTEDDSERSATAICQIKMEFDYSEGKEIIAPADAADYNEIPMRQ